MWARGQSPTKKPGCCRATFERDTNVNAILKQKVETDPDVYWVDVDATLAAEWLKTNSQNRPKKNAKLATYASAMKAGLWKVTGATIQFGKSGRLIDGQNRLQAIIDAGATVRLLVVYGVEDNVFDVIDSGVKRTGSDMLHIEGYEGWIGTCGATASQIAGSLMVGQLPYSRTYSAQGVRQFVLDNPDLMDSVVFMSDLQRKGVPLIHSAGAALHFLMAKKDAFLADSFMRRFYSGEDLSAADTILKLRNLLLARAMGSTGSRGNNTASVGATIRVWNSIRAGRGIKHIQNAFPRTGDVWPAIE